MSCEHAEIRQRNSSTPQFGNYIVPACAVLREVVDSQKFEKFITV